MVILEIKLHLKLKGFILDSLSVCDVIMSHDLVNKTTSQLLYTATHLHPAEKNDHNSKTSVHLKKVNISLFYKSQYCWGFYITHFLNTLKVYLLLNMFVLVPVKTHITMQEIWCSSYRTFAVSFMYLTALCITWQCCEHMLIHRNNHLLFFFFLQRTTSPTCQYPAANPRLPALFGDLWENLSLSAMRTERSTSSAQRWKLILM